MELPTSREYLLNFNKDDYLEKEAYKIRLDYYKILIQNIYNSIKQHLLNNHKSEAEISWIHLNCLKTCDQYMSSTLRNSIDPISFYEKNRVPGKIPSFMLNEFIKILEQNFINCDIYVDPDETYIIIDWM
jgi:predicted secreted protein